MQEKRSSCCCRETSGRMQSAACYRDYQNFSIKWMLAGVSIEASSSKVFALLAAFCNVIIVLLATQRR